MTIKTSRLTLKDVRYRLGFTEGTDNVSYAEFLSVEPITELETPEILQSCNDI